ncbi:sodium-dependent neutral amino acid transporter B(0)AT3-like [Tiliqua scincoides]|uniref:sodium-dependent neutral amino acid transporter B(0)AT3-like n=1 Tax=Tiliqua scincoides TaxID=71010 RepID=UPI00346384B3
MSITHFRDTPNITEDDSRPKWNNKYQFSLSCIGFIVGLGNVWRFPYLCQNFGGGAFLIPYFIAVVLEGIPLFHLELATGQLLRSSGIRVWAMISPYLGGIGYGSLLVSLTVSLYYNIILAWVLWYFANSFQKPLPWSTCPLNESKTGPVEECHQSTETSYFWFRETLNISTDITESGSLQWRLIFCLAACWLFVYICTLKGIQTTVKVLYVTVTFPYLVLTIFFAYGLTLPGAVEGLAYFIIPKVDRLNNPRAWLEATTQVFYSLSLGFGGHIAYSSYNSQKNDCEKDAIVIAVLNSVTSLYSAIPIFSMLGFHARILLEKCLDENIKDLIGAFNLQGQNLTRENYTIWIEALNQTSPNKIASLQLKNCDMQIFLDKSISGTGLSFIVFTEAIVHLPGSRIWAILFFVMLFSLGVSSVFGIVEGILRSLLDVPIVAKSIRKEVISGIICLSSFLMALCFTLRSGNYWLEIFDTYATSFPLIVILFFEVVGIAHIYGVKRFCDDVKWMTGRQPHFYWEATWQIITPILMVTVFVANAVIQTETQPSYYAWNPQYEYFPEKEKKYYPKWVLVIGGFLSTLPCLVIPTVAVFHLVATIVKKREKKVLHPSDSATGT